MFRRRLLLIALTIVCIGGLVHLSPVAAQTEKTLRMALPEGDANSLDPQQYETLAEFQTLQNVYEGLFSYDQKTLKPVPALAEKYEVSSDGLKYTFHLRKGVKFHNGREMTADDVKYSFNRLANPKIATTYARALILGTVVGFDDVDSGKATELSGVKVVDPLTVEITLSQANSAFLPQLTMVPAAIIPKEAADDAKTFNEKPVGTGPFKVTEWVRQQQITLVANPDYWGDKPKLDKVILRVIPEKSSAMVEFAAGNLDLVIVPPSDVARIKADTSLQGRVQDQSILSIFWFMLNVTKPPLDNVKVRQAMSMAIDRAALVKAVLQGQGTPAVGPIPPGLSAYDPSYNPYPFDIDKAKQTLADAGFPNGVDIEIRTWTDEVEGRVLAAVQASWAKAGIRAKINRTEYTAYIDDLTKCNIQVGTSSWTADYADMDNFIIPIPLTDQSTQGKACGYGQFPKVKELALKALTQPLGKDRDATYQAAQKEAVDNAEGIFIYHRGATLAWNANVQGAYLDALNAVKLTPISLK